ncbi:hypothetical protein [Sphingobium sp. GW456-12-10-14-TSB1]|uniref:hypothetical protein n=1 Tax=Sphingobium sp. GW456-12-10-14-TSB1 TaxID=1987165 RepID=UPI0015946BE4|nr:hypothetical protein [Sphingobium sp. GW456-12-10-14-TSB1]
MKPRRRLERLASFVRSAFRAEEHSRVEGLDAGVAGGRGEVVRVAIVELDPLEERLAGSGRDRRAPVA